MNMENKVLITVSYLADKSTLFVENEERKVYEMDKEISDKLKEIFPDLN